MTLPIKTITSVLNVLTDIITSITTHPIGVAAIPVIMSISTHKIVVILYIFTLLHQLLKHKIS